MGGSSLKKVQQTLQKNYKPLRKFYDPFYGQTTILAEIESHKKYCKTQKILFPTKHLSEYISNRVVEQHQVLVQIKQIFKVPIDLCSGNEMYVFILEYAGTTLYQEIIARCSADRSWDIQEILKIMFQMVQIVKIISRVQARKILLSNSSVLYFGPGKIKGIQSVFCNKLDTSDVDFPVIQTENQQNRQYYISPESFQYLCRKEKQRAKEISLQQSSIIFTIGMNFLELVLLADLSELYNKSKNEFEYEKLREAQKNVEQIYGDGVQRLISSMLQLQPHKRSSIADIEDYLKYLAKCNGLILQEYPELTGSCRL